MNPGYLKYLLNTVLLKPSHLRLLANDLRRKKSLPRPADEHLEDTIHWLLASWEATGRKGSSAGYSLVAGWKPAYPETTGYIIQSLLTSLPLVKKEELKFLITEAAASMAKWETDIQLENGAVRGGVYGKDPLGVFKSAGLPVVFNTGMVVLGWAEAYRYFKDKRYLDSAIRACDWLISVQEPEGYWIKGRSESTNAEHYTYYTMVAWAIAEVYKITGDIRYKHSADAYLQWVVKQQQPNGFISYMSFDKGQSPFTHTIAYTLQGILECALLLDEPAYIEAVKKAVDPVLQVVRSLGYLPAKLNENWQPDATYWCVTGNAQFAIVLFKLFQLAPDETGYAETAGKLNRLVKSIQPSRTGNPGLDGGVRGSFPVWEKYIRMSFPNWAAKFFVDALCEELNCPK